jgi:hypothetical protein
VSIRLPPRILAALGNPFVDQRNGWRNVFPYQFLRSDQTMPQSVYSQLIIFGTQDHYLAGLDAECTAKRSRDNNPPLLVDARMTFLPIDDIAGCAPAGSTNTEAAPSLVFFARVGTREACLCPGKEHEAQWLRESALNKTVIPNPPANPD